MTPLPKKTNLLDGPGEDIDARQAFAGTPETSVPPKNVSGIKEKEAVQKTPDSDNEENGDEKIDSNTAKVDSGKRDS